MLQVLFSITTALEVPTGTCVTLKLSRECLKPELESFCQS